MATRKRTNSAPMDKTSQPGTSKAIVPVNSVVRLQRNQAEKQRRDRLNGYISELATLVPMVKNSTKPVDKVSVLRLAAAQMRLNYSCLSPRYFRNKMKVLPPQIASYLQNLEKDIGGFTVVTTFSGTVIFCSKSIEYFAGYQNIDFMGQCIYNYVHPEELSFFERKVNSIISRYKKKALSSDLISVRSRTNDVSYQKMSFRISVHFNDLLQEQTMDDKAAAKSKKIKHKDFGSSAVLLMFVEPVKHNPDNSLLTNPNVYVTIHGVTGEIMYADHRISTITGYMPNDVLQKSAYEYIFESDVPIAQFAQRDMFSSNNGTGVITYRLRTINSAYIYLQSKGQIIYKESSNEISHFICYNKWLSDDEGAEELKNFHKRYSAQSVRAMQMLEKVRENKSDCDESSLSVSTKAQAFISCRKSLKGSNVHQSVNDQSESLKSSSESNIILNSAHNENGYSKQSLFKTESCKESKIAQINHSVNNTIVKDYENIDTCSYNQNHSQNSDECQNDFNDGHPFIQEHSESLEKFPNDSKDNFNSLHSMNEYSCTPQSHLKLKMFRGNNFAQISNSNFENNTPLVNYEKMNICNGTNDYMVDKQIVKQSTVNDFEKINGHHYNQTYDCIVNKPLIKHKNSVHLLSPSLNSERIQDPKSAQYPNNFFKNAHNGSYCNYFGEDSKDLNMSLSNEISQPFMMPIHDIRWQNQASCIKPIDSTSHVVMYKQMNYHLLFIIHTRYHLNIRIQIL
ncbi:aryl hydrocarbon receptor nuclear translocator-like protein 1 [Caerostris extrusa]|uniref:Aryl hydrocarbon receptor nuclear translocator-like protein 1 n=1 Tax=Caerostris extrusa TaxID=172846 RepID=A0AAV4NJH9_CAEEX|nr:aryl hydrocarbon receptor nuclear translocator-like protein 1 [Caerostris extrusa]